MFGVTTSVAAYNYHDGPTFVQKTKIAMKYLFFLFVVVAIGALATATQPWPEPQVPVKITPVNVTIYYDSRCPNSKSFIRDQLYPNFCKVKKYVNLHLVPFNKPNKSTKGFVCQDGFAKCMGNIIHSCVLDRVSDAGAQLDYLNCALSDLMIPRKVDKLCVLKSGLRVNDISNCYATNEGPNLMMLSEIETRIMTHEPTSSPTVVFDNRYNDRDQAFAVANFETALCEKFLDHGLVHVCSNGSILNSRIC